MNGEKTMKNELASRMIRLYGFEHEATIEFFRVMDSLNEEVLKILVESHEQYPCFDIEDED